MTIMDMRTGPEARTMCEECGNHVATLTLDVSEEVEPVEVCGLCALSALLSDRKAACSSLTSPGA